MGSDKFRYDAVAKVTGAAMFSGDFFMEGMVYAKEVRLPVPRAKILRIDTSAAERMPGVVGVFTRKDIEGPNRSGNIGAHDFSQPILVGEGENTENAADAVAVVAAQSEDIAARACDKVKITYEALPAVHTWEAAQAAGRKPACARDIRKGDADAALAASAFVVEDEYFTQFAEHSYLEPEAGVAYLDEAGRVNIRVGTQAVRQQTAMVCEALGLPYDKVRLYAPYVGGGFGGKHSLTVHVLIALLALKLRRPVRMVWTREESVRFSCKKQSLTNQYQLGFDAEGHITALKARVNGPTTAYTAKSMGRLSNYLNFLMGPYRQPNLDIEGRLYNTTSVEIGAFRGVAGPDGTYVIETAMDRAAAALGIDPVEIRRRNWFNRNDEIPEQFPGCLARNFAPELPLEGVLQAALREAGTPAQAKKGWLAGRGIACACPSYAGYNSDNQCNTAVTLTLNLDGTFTVRAGFPEIGQGMYGMLASIMRIEFNAAQDEVQILLSDTDTAPIGGELGFSIGTVNAGGALADACKKMKLAMREGAALALGLDVEEVEFDAARRCFTNRQGEVLLDWAAYKKYCFLRVSNPTVTGRVDTDPKHRNEYGITPIAAVVDLEVDPETGVVEIQSAVQCVDIGKLLQPESARGQILGATVMGMGTATMEAYLVKDGLSLTPSFAEYLIPTALDIPKVNKALFLEGNPAVGVGPYGAKGLGEFGMYAVNAAISNALFHATGAAFPREPITAEVILKALHKF